MNHDELLWALSDGSRTDIEAWDRADVFEVFRGLTIHQARVTKKLGNGDDHRVRGLR
jgi:hypothetical protein